MNEEEKEEYLPIMMKPSQMKEFTDEYAKLLTIVKRTAENTCCICCDPCLSCDAQDVLKEISKK